MPGVDDDSIGPPQAKTIVVGQEIDQTVLSRPFVVGQICGITMDSPSEEDRPTLTTPSQLSTQTVPLPIIFRRSYYNSTDGAFKCPFTVCVLPTTYMKLPVDCGTIKTLQSTRTGEEWVGRANSSSYFTKSSLPSTCIPGAIPHTKSPFFDPKHDSYVKDHGEDEDEGFGIRSSLTKELGLMASLEMDEIPRGAPDGEESLSDIATLRMLKSHTSGSMEYLPVGFMLSDIILFYAYVYHYHHHYNQPSTTRNSSRLQPEVAAGVFAVPTAKNTFLSSGGWCTKLTKDPGDITSNCSKFVIKQIHRTHIKQLMRGVRNINCEVVAAEVDETLNGILFPYSLPNNLVIEPSPRAFTTPYSMPMIKETLSKREVNLSIIDHSLLVDLLEVFDTVVSKEDQRKCFNGHTYRDMVSFTLDPIGGSGSSSRLYGTWNDLILPAPRFTSLRSFREYIDPSLIPKKDTETTGTASDGTSVSSLQEEVLELIKSPPSSTICIEDDDDIRDDDDILGIGKTHNLAQPTVVPKLDHKDNGPPRPIPSSYNPPSIPDYAHIAAQYRQLIQTAMYFDQIEAQLVIKRHALSDPNKTHTHTQGGLIDTMDGAPLKKRKIG
jgi:hypothetical protein